MNNYKAIIQYNGKKFAGFAKQKEERTVEAELLYALSAIFKKSPKLTVAGRTDSGVHALGQVISFRGPDLMNESELRYKLNAILPKDIKIKEIEIKDASFDARRSAVARQYVYYILNCRYKTVFSDEYSLHYPLKLSLPLMRKGASYLKGINNFRAFSALNPSQKSFIRDMKLIRIENKTDFFDLGDEDVLKITIKANAFLYKMVRIIVGTLIDVGRGKIEATHIKKILESQDRQKASPAVLAKGLFLEKVYYHSD